MSKRLFCKGHLNRQFKATCHQCQVTKIKYENEDLRELLNEANKRLKRSLDFDMEEEWWFVMTPDKRKQYVENNGPVKEEVL